MVDTIVVVHRGSGDDRYEVDEGPSHWLDLIDDLGETAWVDGVDRNRLLPRLRERGVRTVDDPGQAATLLTDGPRLLALDAEIGDETTIVCVARNPLLSFVPGRRHATGASLRRIIAATGLDEVRTGDVFGLLPSPDDPRTALSLRSPVARSAIGAALALHLTGRRRAALRVIGALGRHGWPIYPGWLVVAHGRGRAQAPRISGQFGYAGKSDVTRLIGEPPSAVERQAAAARLAGEAGVLHELAGTAFRSRVPSVISTPAERRSGPGHRTPALVTSVVPGVQLEPRSLSPAALESWVESAARLLTQLQEATRDPSDGSVIVHGDYWLGNLIVDGTEIVGVIDWEAGRRGDAGIDRDFLVTSMVGYLELDARTASRLRSAAERGFRADGSRSPVWIDGDRDGPARQVVEYRVDEE